MLAAIALAAYLEGIDGKVLEAICTVESGLDSSRLVRRDGKSPSTGLCQVKRIAAEHMGLSGRTEDLLNPYLNARVAARYLRYQLHRYRGDRVCAIKAYNAGSCRKNNISYYNKVMGVLHGL